MSLYASSRPIFFYGLFMDMAALRSKGLSPRAEQVVTVRNYVVRLGVKAMLLSAPGRVLAGVMAEISQADFSALYAHQTGYREIPVIVRTRAGDLISASTMVHTDPPLEAALDLAYAMQWRAIVMQLGIEPPD